MDDWKAGRTPVPTTKEDFNEYRKLIAALGEACGEPSEYHLKFYGILVSYAKRMQYEPEIFEEIKEKLALACS